MLSFHVCDFTLVKIVQSFSFFKTEHELSVLKMFTPVIVIYTVV